MLMSSELTLFAHKAPLIACLVLLETQAKSGNAHAMCMWASAGGQFTGAALNPARVLGPAIVFHCYWNTAFIYVFGELFGGLIAAIIVLPLYGFGQFGSLLDTRVCSALGIKIPEKHQHRCTLHSTRHYTQFV